MQKGLKQANKNSRGCLPIPDSTEIWQAVPYRYRQDSSPEHPREPFAMYIGQSKMQRVIIEILSNREIWDNEVYDGALSLRTLRRLLFKNKRMTNSQRASLCRTIKRLEQDGLIARERMISEDGYTSHIGLTEHGWYQSEYNRTWIGQTKLVELLTFYGLLSSEYAKKVNKIRKKANRG